MRLDESVLPLTRANPGRSGVVPLAHGPDAFAARMLLADAAEQSLDVQYYIWHADLSGTLLFEALRRAADRGVRVRLLLDDNNTVGLDAILGVLNAHGNIEVRLFNPFRHRRWRVLDYVTDFARLNRRMHNKSFTADNQVTIVGGRNVGDEYFGAGHGVSFVDLDVLAIGAVVNDVSDAFDRYWASESASPATRVLRSVDRASMSIVADAAARVERDPQAAAYTEALARDPFVQELLAGALPFEWVTATMITDDPAKGLGHAADDALLWPRLKSLLGAPTSEMQLISAYFVPGKEGVEYLAGLSKKGMKITIFTNSLEATDVAAVHAGYAKRRRPLLEAGVAIFEMRRTNATPSVKERGLRGSSGSSLHAKTVSVDRSRAFVGSFNFDPRSARLNTEMGFLIDSPSMAGAIADAFTHEIAAQTYTVRLGHGGKYRWVEQRDGREIEYDQEPHASIWRRLGVNVLAMLPIEWLL